MANRPLPTGTLTFFFSDIEGSTKMVQRLGPRWKDALERHEALVREALAPNGGVEVRTVGDAFFVVFPTADRAVAAAVAAQRAHAGATWPEDGTVRMRVGLHTGIGELGGDDYVGIDVHMAARIAGAAHGGQIVVSDQTKEQLRSPGEAIGTRELGEHRLKDVGTLRLWQVTAPGLETAFPPLSSLEIPSNLPADATSFVGREREVTEIRELVRSKRLVTLTGPGGTGKTRLSLRVAHEITPEFPHGVFFVALEPIREAALVAATIAQALSYPEDPKRPATQVLKEGLRDRATLLVLDNFEQIVAAAPLVGELLAAAPRLRCLASSREALHVYGEQEYPVPALSEGDAVALFVQRAEMAKPGFAVTDANRDAIRAICARVDRLPLAIELAAARVKVFSPDAIRTRLERSLALLTSGSRDLPERQRTLRGAIAWSNDLLDEPEKALFRRLAAFVGGCRSEAAEAVCDPEAALGMLVIDALPSFVDKSLLRCSEDPDGETRFAMLETIREFAGEKLEESGEADEVRRRHAAWVLALCREAEPALNGGDDAPWLARLAVEHDNIRAALRHVEATGSAETGLAIAGAVWRFWQQRGHLAEGRSTCERLLALPAAAAPTAGRAAGLSALAGLAYWQGDFAPLAASYREGVAIYRAIGDRPRLAEAIFNESFVGFVSGDLELGRARLEESRALFEELGDANSVSRANEALAAIQFRLGALPDALETQAQVVRHRRAGRNAFHLADSLTLYALLLFDNARIDEGRRAIAEALEMQRAMDYESGAVALLMIAARQLVREGEAARAARVCGAVAAIRERTTVGATPLEILGIPDPEIGAREALGAEAFEREFAAGHALTVEQASELALG